MAESTSPDTGTERETVTSPDGTEIAFERTGSGPPLVLVHGAGGDHNLWEFFDVRTTLADHCTVYAIDRRGRGGSGDASAHDLGREVADVVAVVEAVDEPVTLFGQSYGALCALEAALRTDHLRRLIVYEGIVSGDDETKRAIIDELLAEIQPLVDEGQSEEAFEFLMQAVGVPSEVIETVRSTPAWDEMSYGAEKLPRELRTFGEYEFDPSRFEAVTTPTLLLVGEESDPTLRAGTEAVAEALPNSRIETIEGHGHGANLTAPDRFTDEVLSFVRESR